METRWQKATVAMLAAMIWWPAILLTLATHYQYARFNILLPYARSLGYAHSSELTAGEFLYVFSTTILTAGVLLPVATFAISFFVSSKLAVRATLVGAFALAALSYAQLVAIGNTGTFINMPLLIEAGVTAISEPALAKEYVSLRSITVFILLLMATGCIAWAAAKLRVRNTARPPRVVFGLLTSVGILPFVFGYATLQNRADVDPRLNFVVQEVRALLSSESATDTRFDNLSLDAAVTLFQENVAAPGASRDSRYWGVEKGSNVIIVNLETAPQVVIDYANEQAFSTMRNLAREGFHSFQHYSTYPYTSDALFSLLGSLYPNNLRREVLARPAAAARQNIGRLGLFNALARADYTTGVYMQDAVFEEDRAMLALFGAHFVSIPEADAADSPSILDTVNHITSTIPGYPNISGAAKSSFERKLGKDVVNLEKMRSDIRAYAATGKNFALAFLPLTGHGPWPDLGPELTLFESGAAIFALQDVWLAQILETLDEVGLANNTIVVITADHGLRTIEEYPDLRPGTLNRISFNVPLIVRAPSVPPQTAALPYRTSHIDVAPTILALLGIDDPQMLMLGSPIWDPRIADRRTYVLGKSYLGVDGFFEGESFYTFQPMMESATVSDEMFSVESATTATAAAAQQDEIEAELAMQESFQRAVAQQLLESTTDQQPAAALAKNP